MPRGKILNNEEKSFIDGFIMASEGKKLCYKDIQDKLNIRFKTSRSHQVISKYINNRDTYDTQRGPGPSYKFSPRLRRNIVMSVLQSKRENNLSLRSMAKEAQSNFNVSISHMGIQRILKESEKVIYAKVKGKPYLKKLHKTNRLVFAKNLLEHPLKWSEILWSDEKWFTLNGPDFYHSYWHHISDKPMARVKIQKGGGGVMAWGVFSGSGKKNIAITNRSLDSSAYIDILDKYLLQLIPAGKKRRSEVYFQQDNASVHTSGLTKAFIQRHRINTIEWPSLSPDLNPIENVWGILANMIYGGNKQYSSKQELEVAILENWERIPSETMLKLSQTFPRRLLAVVENKGSSTPY